MYKDHDVISYLHHIVVTTADPASPPSHDLLPNFAVNFTQTTSLDLLDIMIQDLLCTNKFRY